jgi:2-methylcitrate dehydratase PrpD
MESTCRELSEFISRLRYEDIPTTTVQKIKDCVLDLVRLMIIGSEPEWATRTLNVFKRMGGVQESTVPVFGDQLPAAHAAYVNGTISHGLENDDTHVAAIHHPGVTVIPAALALGERQGLDGRALITAITAGYEVMIRLGVSLQPSLYGERGFHGTAVMGHFGAAAAAARLLGLDTVRTGHALGFAAASASGLANWLSGGMVKYIHAGKAARAGVESALLSAEGLTGPRQVFEGKHGFCHAYSNRFDLAAITRGLGQEWKTLEVHLKPHFTSRHTQASIEATARLAAEHGIKPSEVDSIEVITSPEMAETMSNKMPQDVIQAQSSIPFVVATALVKGGEKTLSHFLLFSDMTSAMANPEVLSLTSRVNVQGNRRFDVQQGNAEVTITLRGGASHTRRVDIIRGSPENPFSTRELQARLITQGSHLLPRAQLVQATQLVDGLETLPKINQLMRVLNARKGNRG